MTLECTQRNECPLFTIMDCSVAVTLQRTNKNNNKYDCIF